MDEEEYKDEKEVEKIVNDMNKYIRKLNEMMRVSVGGECPQIHKILLMKKMSEKWLEEAKKHSGKEVVEEAEQNMENMWPFLFSFTNKYPEEEGKE